MPDNVKQKEIERWLREHKIEDVEILISDFAGISRGKKLPKETFVNALGQNTLRLPESIFGTTVDGKFIDNEFITVMEQDVFLRPDLDASGMVPWNDEPTAYFICDVVQTDGSPSNLAPRQVLKNVLAKYAEKGWQPVVAPEYEFTLLAQDKAAGLDAPTGRSGASASTRGYMSLDGLNEFDPVFNDVKSYCAAMGLPMDALVQEAGAGQYEFNIGHGNAVQLADHTFQFKRIMKWAAVKHGFDACFMAKPYPEDFGNAMHIHQSVIEKETGDNVFADKNGKDTNLFRAHIAGLQKYLPAAMPFLAPYENSYLRLSDAQSSPINTHWGVENRTVGLRVPEGGRASRRIENRIAGSDVNPYLAMAASLACGFLGMAEKLPPSEALSESAYDVPGNTLPGNIHAGLEALDQCKPLRELLGDGFVTTYVDVKKLEIRQRARVLSDWDKQYLRTNV